MPAIASKPSRQAMYWPPLIDRVEPVMKPASSEGEEDDPRGRFFRLTKTPDRDLRDDFGIEHIRRHGLDHLVSEI